MRVGALLPNDEVDFGNHELRAWALTAEQAGLDHIVLADHVLGADPEGNPGWGAGWAGTSNSGAYTTHEVFREPFVIMGHLSALVQLELMTGVLVLPQRQTALVAKQAAEVDRLTGGRLRLGVGVGWNPVEYRALGQPFERRGELIEEQIALLRRFWTEPVVAERGTFHDIPPSGIQQLPVQRPIPLWMGGDAPRVLERVGRLADGWFMYSKLGPGPEFDASVAIIRASAERAGRDPQSIGVEPRLVVGTRSDDDLRREVGAWRTAGVTHLCIDTRFGGRDPAQHSEQLDRMRELIARG